LNLILLVLHLSEGLLLGFHNSIVICGNHLVDLVQFTDLCVVIPLHVLEHGLESGSQLLDSLVVGTLEFLAHSLDSGDIDLFDFHILVVSHSFSIL
jgi:hypothetical protein